MDQRYTSNLERYYEDFHTVLSDIRNLLAEFRSCGSERKKITLQATERAIDEAVEIIGQMEIEVLHVPLVSRLQEKTRINNYHNEINCESLHIYEQYDESFASNQDLESLDQRNRLLAGTRKLEESSERLKNAERVANETKEIGANILKDLGYQREQIILTRNTLIETDSYLDRSMRTLKTMARR
ncbi:hypothetical protein PMAC_001202 [Pneumocystis sp. 'macacae']|nr:hypothetical protein PMAC_001202 [Pneumocystis sp. 'macacae']